MPAHCAGMLASCRQRGTERRAPIPSNRKILRVQAGSDNGEANRRSLQRAKRLRKWQIDIDCERPTDLISSSTVRTHEATLSGSFPDALRRPRNPIGLTSQHRKKHRTNDTRKGRFSDLRPLFKLDRNLGEAAHSKSSELIHKSM